VSVSDYLAQSRKRSKGKIDFGLGVLGASNLRIPTATLAAKFAQAKSTLNDSDTKGSDLCSLKFFSDIRDELSATNLIAVLPR
jgi:hypothetical protein